MAVCCGCCRRETGHGSNCRYAVPYGDKHPARLAVKVEEGSKVVPSGYRREGAYVRCGRFQVFCENRPRALRKAAKKARRLEAEAQRLEGTW